MAKYVLLDAPTTEQLEQAVDEMLSIGFVPVGGIYVDRYSYKDRNGDLEHEAIYYQAVFIPATPTESRSE